MNRGGVSHETGANTLAALVALEEQVKSLRRIVSTAIRNGYLVASHADLASLAYAVSGHTGFASSTSLTAHTSNVSNPHSVTHTQVAAPKLYSQALEPSAVSEFALWYQPATGGAPGKLYVSVEDETATWAWRGPVFGG